MTSEATPEREELLASAAQLDGIAGNAPHDNSDTGAIHKAAGFLRLAGIPDPDSMNERRIAEDTRLASNVREALIRAALDEAARNHVIPVTACDRALLTRAIVRALSTTEEPKR